MEALLACAGVTLRSVATVYGVEIRSARLTAAGSFDARGTLGLDSTVLVGVGDITVTAELDTDGDDATAQEAGRSDRAVLRGESKPAGHAAVPDPPPTVTMRHRPIGSFLPIST